MFVGKLEVGGLKFVDHRTPNRFVAFALGSGASLGHLTTQPELPRIGQVLRDPQAEVGEVTVGESGEGPRAPDTKLLDGNLRIGRR